MLPSSGLKKPISQPPNPPCFSVSHRDTICFMIIGFRHKGLEAFYKKGTTKGIQTAHAAKLRRILALLDVATSTDDLNLPSFKLHPLKGGLKGHWSIYVNGNWRITFRFIGVDVELVNYLDYH